MGNPWSFGNQIAQKQIEQVYDKKVNRAHNEIHKGNQTINNLSDELQRIRPLSDAMKDIRNYENVNPIVTMQDNIIHQASLDWEPSYTDDVENPDAPAEYWELSLKGKRRKNLHIIAIAECLTNSFTGNSALHAWSAHALKKLLAGESIERDVIQHIINMNESEKLVPRAPTKNIKDRIEKRVEELTESVVYDEVNTLPKLDSIPPFRIDSYLVENTEKTGLEIPTGITKEFIFIKNTFGWDRLENIFV
jgi:hypothetical protein